MAQRGQMIEKAEGKWLLRIYLGRVSGKRQYASEAFEGTTSQATKRLTQMLNEKDVGSFVAPSKQTVHDYLTDWLTHKANVATKTRLDYEHRMAKDVYPFIGTVRLDKLTPAHIRSLYTKLTSERGLSARTIRYTHTVLAQALELACEDGLMQKNPCKRSSVREVIPETADVGVSILTVEEVLKVWAAESELQKLTLWRLLLTTGLRPQEALAIRWDDLSGVFLSISRALHAVGKGKYEVTDKLKTTGSKRIIALSSETLAQLTKHKAAQAVEIMAAGPKYARHGYVFATRTGTPLDISNVRRWWKAVCLAAKIPERRLYDTRHTHLSHLLESGENPKAVAERSGHCDPTTLMNSYAHTLPGASSRLAQTQETMYQRKAAL